MTLSTSSVALVVDCCGRQGWEESADNELHVSGCLSRVVVEPGRSPQKLTGSLERAEGAGRLGIKCNLNARQETEDEERSATHE